VQGDEYGACPSTELTSTGNHLLTYALQQRTAAARCRNDGTHVLVDVHYREAHLAQMPTNDGSGLAANDHHRRFVCAYVQSRAYGPDPTEHSSQTFLERARRVGQEKKIVNEAQERDVNGFTTSAELDAASKLLPGIMRPTRETVSNRKHSVRARMRLHQMQINTSK